MDWQNKPGFLALLQNAFASVIPNIKYWKFYEEHDSYVIVVYSKIFLKIATKGVFFYPKYMATILGRFRKDRRRKFDDAVSISAQDWEPRNLISVINWSFLK
jgi:hypothetical protein